MNIDLEELAAVIRLIKELEFSEFSYAKGDVSLVVRRGELPVEAPADTRPLQAAAKPPTSVASAAAAATRVQAPAAPTSHPAQPGNVSPGPVSSVTAPLLGSFYGAPKPGDAPFVSVGDRVEADTVVCIIEVMKLMNSVVAGVAGIVAAIHANDGELVEHGQTLFTIQPAPSV